MSTAEARLRERIDELEETVRQLRVLAFGENLELPIDIKAPRQGKTILRILLSKSPKVVTYDHLAAVIWPNNERADPNRSLSVEICKLRKALREAGVEIKSYWGEGYYLPTASANRLREMVGSP